MGAMIMAFMCEHDPRSRAQEEEETQSYCTDHMFLHTCAPLELEPMVMIVTTRMMPCIFAPISESSGRMPVAVGIGAATVVGRPGIPRGSIAAVGVVMVSRPASAVLVIDMPPIGGAMCKDRGSDHQRRCQDHSQRTGESSCLHIN